uniref:IucA/IucC family protein n=1 Tax=Halomonas sp. TaxID=1486246 RepID=UPI00260E7D67|nr:IucA/IucC family protein [Halomonas sp.]
MSQHLNPRTPCEVSRQASWHALLNCTVKELAIPGGLLSYQWPANQEGLPELSHGIPLLIEWPNGLSLFVLVDRKSTLGSQYYLSDLYLRDTANATWQVPEFAAFAGALVKACQHFEDGGSNAELLDQICQSRDVMHDIVQHAGDSQSPLQDYPGSEHGLWFGHPNHPSPKARQWPPELDAHRYGPEFRPGGCLYQFEVPRDGLQINANRIGSDAVLACVADQRHAASTDRAVISMHPVQAALFKQDPRVVTLLRDGVLRDLGETGFAATPTASMRTWYIADHPFFIKGSLNVRITNCVRKNAWYELESTLVIDRIMHQLMEQRDPALAALCVSHEPATLHWAPAWADDDTQLWFREQTGIILRENFCRQEGAENCLMAGTLFARDTGLVPLAPAFVAGESSETSELPSEDTLAAWFDGYLHGLIQPVLALFFRHGIVMEPHLQNCVLVHQDGRPQRILLRDFEGVKLTDDKGVDWLAGECNLPSRVRESMIYSREKGWQRIAYCLFINHLSEAILALSWQRPELGEQLWTQVFAELKRVREVLAVETPELDALIAGEALPCKTNFKLRLSAQADRQAQYVHLPSPWCKEKSQEAIYA